MFVRDNMTKDPVCITPDQTISQVVDLMSEKKLHRLPVVQGKRIVGLVTEGTISASGASKATSLSISRSALACRYLCVQPGGWLSPKPVNNYY